MTRILVVEDEDKIGRFIELELTHEGYEVKRASDGHAGAEVALGEDFDLILLDILLPQINGMEVLRRIRRVKQTPVIMLTARDSVMDKVAGLDAGADDYITKPFAIEELLARIRVALKRRELASGSAGTEAGNGRHVLELGGVTLDPDRREVLSRGEPVTLTNREFEVLRCLLEHAGTVLTRERIAHDALGYEYAGDTNNVDVHIARLRAKVEEPHGIKIIHTVRGVGYVAREA